ncbi:hypothetical protein [Bradyrhizobium sp. AS23.2]|uniref:hypothetical protein n=1 Tax=Bradyrhizobium sp. AS23.2 TaxID=1680155 RepID=UPI00093EE2B3|nr:hypothetical protein [Bradyrhizobium sp. AS23.2]OKO76048.1 hypothetical protein AC630_23710 [Bradyrhizobium sp. AS23.2]
MNQHEDEARVIRARSRLKEARKWFTYRGWTELPHDDRGRSIPRWGADHAWLANPDNPMRSVRNWCRCWGKRFSKAELDRIIAETETSNKRWNADQCAMVLGITVSDREMLGLRFLGACDDLSYEIRLGIKREKAAARARKHRAKNSTGRKRGRPALALSEQDKLARKKAQDSERAKRYRASRKNASRHISNIGSVTEFSVTRTPSAFASFRADAIEPPSFNLAKFGITAIQIRRGRDILSTWRQP